MSRSRSTILLQALYHGGFLLLAVLALLLYQERLFGDGAKDVFGMVNEESFFLLHERYILFFSQWLPLLGIKLGAQLKTVLLLYSVGHILYFYVLFLISYYLLRDKMAGVAYLVLLTFSDGYPFFAYPMSELQFGLGLVILLHSIAVTRKSIGWGVRLAAILPIPLIVTSHPLNIYVLAAVSVLHLRNTPLFRDMYYRLALLILVFGSLYWMVAFDHGNWSYAGASIVWNPGAIQAASIWKYLVYNWPITLMFIAVSACFLDEGDRRTALLTGAAFFAPVLLFSMHPLTLNEVPQNYSLVLLAVILFPVTDRLLTRNARYRYVSGLAVGLLCLIGISAILWQADYFRHERKKLDAVLNAIPEEKCLLMKRMRRPDGNYYFRNPTFYMSTLYSAMEDPDSTRVLQLMGYPLDIFPEDFRDTLPGLIMHSEDMEIARHYSYVLQEEIIPEPNPEYFDWPTTVSQLAVLDSVNSFEALHDRLSVKLKIDKRWYAKELYRERSYINLLSDMCLDISTIAPPVYSGSANGVEFRIRVTDMNGRLKFPQIVKMLPCDIYRSAELPLKLQVPRRLRRFTVDLEVWKDDRPLNTGDRVLIRKRNLLFAAWFSAQRDV